MRYGAMLPEAKMTKFKVSVQKGYNLDSVYASGMYKGRQLNFSIIGIKPEYLEVENKDKLRRELEIAFNRTIWETCPPKSETIKDGDIL